MWTFLNIDVHYKSVHFIEPNNRHLTYFLNESNLDISSKTLIQIKTLALKAYNAYFNQEVMDNYFLQF